MGQVEFHSLCRRSNPPENSGGRRTCSPPGRRRRAGATPPVVCVERRKVRQGLWEDIDKRHHKKTPRRVLIMNTYLSVGTAVQAKLWDVPAVICWMDTPSSPSTFLGLVMGVEVWPWPHCPMVLLPQAYTSFSEESRTISGFTLTVIAAAPSELQADSLSYRVTGPGSDCLHTRYRWFWWCLGPLWTGASATSSQRSRILNRSHSPRQTPEETMRHGFP